MDRLDATNQDRRDDPLFTVDVAAAIWLLELGA